MPTPLIDALRQFARATIAEFHLDQQQRPTGARMNFIGPHICDEAADRIERLERRLEAAAHTIKQERQRADHFGRLLSGIHGLLYPPRLTDDQGRTWAFNSPDPHQHMQMLSDRIRALGDELKASAAGDGGLDPTPPDNAMLTATPEKGPR